LKALELERHEALTQTLEAALERSSPLPGEAFPCPYLPGREARHVTLVPRPLSGPVYHALMDLNFRRMGEVFYKPVCEACSACRMLRVPVAGFTPSRAQRRTRERNRDLRIRVAAPQPTEEKLALYRTYLEARHVGSMDGSAEEFEAFLYSSGIDTFEVEYRVGEKLLGVGIMDVTPLALSAVYFYFDPAQAVRSPGVFNVLWLLEEAGRRGAPWLYLGYYVAEASSMRYKASYRPSQVLGAADFQGLDASEGRD
jgi:arginyl-tRNA--protein-N-Asp/Glu arginylyltransferase